MCCHTLLDHIVYVDVPVTSSLVTTLMLTLTITVLLNSTNSKYYNKKLTSVRWPSSKIFWPLFAFNDSVSNVAGIIEIVVNFWCFCKPLSRDETTWQYSIEIPFNLHIIFSARCNIYISHLCYNVNVRLSVTEVHWRIIANLGFKFRSKFTAHCSRGEG